MQGSGYTASNNMIPAEPSHQCSEGCGIRLSAFSESALSLLALGFHILVALGIVPLISYNTLYEIVQYTEVEYL